MFNGYNETPLISYEFSQERLEKKDENAPKWTSYGHDAPAQSAATHPNNRHPTDFWSGKPGFLGISNVVKCNCTACYPSAQNQSYQGDTTRHRPWLPRTFPVPLNGSTEPCKLPAYQWDGGTASQGPCYSDKPVPYGQENGGKHHFYRHYQEPTHPPVMTKKKPKDDGQDAPPQNGLRQPVFCNPIYNLAKRADGRNYCDPNAASYSVDQQHMARLPVVEPYIKAVPSNLTQNRVPSTGYRSVKENVTFAEPGYGDPRKMCPETEIGGEKAFATGQPQTGTHLEYSHFARDLSEADPHKLFFDSARHSDFYSRKNLQDVITRNNQNFDKRRDCLVNQMNVSEQHYKHQDAGNSKPSCEAFYPKDFEKSHLENPVCFQQRNEEKKNDSVNVHARLPRSTLIFNDGRFPDRTQNAFPYQNDPPLAAYRNQVPRPEHPYQGHGGQHRYEHPAAFQRSSLAQYRAVQQQMQACEQLIPQQGNGFVYDPQCQNAEITAQFCGGKKLSPVPDTMPLEGRKATYLEAVRSEGTNKNGTSKISPLRLLRKKKFINVPYEPAAAPRELDAAPGLDVRKFWSTWAEEEEENVAPTQMVVLDCQNIEPEQAQLLHLYDSDPFRAVQLESGSIVFKGSGCAKESEEGVQQAEESLATANAENEKQVRQKESETGETCWKACSEPESKSAVVESVPAPAASCRPSHEQENEGNKKTGSMDKWTEKKFDFLKRSEESKAAEMLRHEEEKKKIFETRLSLQQGLKKVEKNEISNCKETHQKTVARLSPSDENSQSSSPDEGSAHASNLPTSEYRRNKFLDYSDKDLILKGKEKSEAVKGADDADVEEVKKEKAKLGCADPAEDLFPSLDIQLKNEPCFEVEDILQKMSEINFQSKEPHEEVKKSGSKKLRALSKKVKRKKSEQEQENDQRTDKLTLETVSKPTIKFSIQKSHDLKISFKVLNNSKKCSDEESGNKDTETEGTPVEDSKNSTEFITLKYKSIQRDGDRRPISGSRKSKRRFRRKKVAVDARAPVLKIKKSRYMQKGSAERDPLGHYENDLGDVNGDGEDGEGESGCLAEEKKPYSDEYSTSEDFRVHETVDSAKIKLTFKRHRNRERETQYKVNSKSGIGEEKRKSSESLDHSKKSKSRKAKRSEIFAEAGVECFQDNPDTTCDIPNEEPILNQDASLSPTSQDSYTEEENYVLEPGTETLPESMSFEDGLGEAQQQVELIPKGEEKEEDEEKNKCGGFSLSECNEFSDENSKGLTLGEEEEKARDFYSEEVEEISLDFITSTKGQEIETNYKSGMTDTPIEENNLKEKKECDLQNPNGTFNSLSSHKSVSEKSDVSDNQEGKSDVQEGLCEWNETSPENNPLTSNQREYSESNDLLVPLFPCEIDNIVGVTENLQEHEFRSNGEKFPEKEPLDENRQNPNENFSQPHPDELALSGAAVGRAENIVEDLIQNEPDAKYFPTDIDFPSADIENPVVGPDTRNGSSDEFLQVPGSASDYLQISLPPHESNAECDVLNLQLNPVGVTFSFENGHASQESPTGMTVPEISKIGFEEVDLLATGEITLPEPEPDQVECCFTFSGKVNDEPELYLRNNQQEQKEEDRPSEEDSAEKMDAHSPVFPQVVKERPKNFVLPQPAADELSFSSQYTNSISAALPSPQRDVELEDGEIVDSSDEDVCETRESLLIVHPVNEERRRSVQFIERNIKRRHSVEPESPGKVETASWSIIRFSKAKSCPPELKFLGESTPTNVAVEEIPLPYGPPPDYSCFRLEKDLGLGVKTQWKSSNTEAKEKPKGSISTEEVLQEVKREELEGKSVIGRSELENERNPSGPVADASSMGIFQRSSKIKFSLCKRTRFPKFGAKRGRDSIAEVFPQLSTAAEEKADLEAVKKVSECQSKEVGNTEVGSRKEENGFGQPVGLLGGDLEENIEVMNDFMRDEFYECEDIPTSEDLTNGDELEVEKVNDDKFRNIMQNCLDNAKKFLNVGNLKLFSCSVDDLLELDCPVPESEHEVQANHISRDVLLTSCEDTNDELGLTENTQPADLSMDFVPSFCSDVCPEILPVDNWPYLEEEVPSSPGKPEVELIPPLETASPDSNNHCSMSFFPKNAIERRKRVIGESCLKRFRRRSLMSEVEAIRMSSKIGSQRRKTVESFSGISCGKEIRDVKSGLMRSESGKDEGNKQSLKCRLSLEKLTHEGISFGFKSTKREKNGKSLDYRSPVWQPKVMLFRISKNEVRKLRKGSRKPLDSKTWSDHGAKREIPSEPKNMDVPALKKQKPDSEVEKLYVKLEHEPDAAMELPGLESIKGSLSTSLATDPDARKRKRFRNLHTKRKTESADPKSLVLSEALRERDCDFNTQTKSTEEVVEVAGDDERLKKNSSVRRSSPEPLQVALESVETRRSGGDVDLEQHEAVEKSGKRDATSHRDRRRDKHRDRHRESEKRESRHQSERSKHSGRCGDSERERQRRPVGSGEEKSKSQREKSPHEGGWCCGVCGFNDAKERVAHIKTHPFHCQSCHLALKTETHFVHHLTKRHKNIRTQHHCLLCELSFDTEDRYRNHLESREHRHLESVEKNTINTLLTLLTGAPCPVLGLLEVKPEWLPNQPGTVHFYHQATPLSLALQYLKMHRDLTSFSTVSSAHPN